MGLYALTLSGVTRLKRQMFGTQVQQQDGTYKDTGVNSFVQELIAALSDQNPINMPAPLVLNAPGGNGPSIIINRFDTSNINNDNSGGPITNINGGVIRFIDQRGNIIDIPGPNGSPINITNSSGGSGGGTGISTTVTVVTAITGATFSVSGCTGTLSVNVSTVNLQFSNGDLVGIA